MKPLLSIICTLALFGCAAIDYKTVPVDSASPPNAESLSKCPVELKNDSCTARVQADQWFSPTGIEVKTGESYCIKVLPNQVWFDLTRRNTPPHGEKGSRLMNLATKRHPDAGFFSLMIDVESQAAKGETAKPVASLPNGRYTTQSPGHLVLYPNDAIGPANDPEWYYKNNSGYIWVTVTRCD